MFWGVEKEIVELAIEPDMKKAGNSINGPMIATKAAPELMPKTATITAIASSKSLLAAVNDSVEPWNNRRNS